MEYLNKYNEWLQSNEIDEETKEDLRKIEGNDEEIKEMIAKQIEEENKSEK